MATAHAEVSDLRFSPPPRAAGRLRRYAPAPRPAETGAPRIPDYAACDITVHADDIAALDAALDGYQPPASVRVRTRGEGAAG
ncbi:hypothetical protein [Marinactinospora rubrisoli]|uniref:Uncharacterized protein n=1 Tax=Marinactinospora rubrisoli TaxID=2715399 RepID=A0ABW2KND2_9ACTN